jgi:hypothetical protein
MLREVNMYTVEYSVKGAYRISRKKFGSVTAAAQFAVRWRSSNSTGEYVAYVLDPTGRELRV